MGRFCPAMTTSVQRKLPNCCQLIVSVFVHHQSSIIHHHHHILDCLLCFACLLAISKETRLYLHEKKTQSSARKKKKCCLDALSVGVSKFPHLQRAVRAHTHGHIASSSYPIPSIPSNPSCFTMPMPYHAHTMPIQPERSGKKNPHVVVSS